MIGKTRSKCATALLLLSLTGGACGTHIGTSENAPMSEADADQNVADRLAETARVNKQIDALRNAFKEAGAVMKTLSNVLNQKLPQNPGDALVQLVDRFPEVFGSLSRAMVKTEIDGTWDLEAPLIGGTSLSDIAQCQSPRARLTGKRVLDREDVVLYLSDCSGADWDRYAKWIVRPDGGIEMSYWPLVSANLRPIQGAPSTSESLVGSCRLTLSGAKKELSLSCPQPSNAGATSASAPVLENLAIRDVPQGTAVSVRVGFGVQSRVFIELAPDHAPDVMLCQDGGKPCSKL